MSKIPIHKKRRPFRLFIKRPCKPKRFLYGFLTSTQLVYSKTMENISRFGIQLVVYKYGLCTGCYGTYENRSSTLLMSAYVVFTLSFCYLLLMSKLLLLFIDLLRLGYTLNARAPRPFRKINCLTPIFSNIME